MKKMIALVVCTCCFLCLMGGNLKAATASIDTFDDSTLWSPLGNVSVEKAKGVKNDCVSLKFELSDSQLWVGIARDFDSIIIPSGYYTISFLMKGEGENNIEFKLMDAKGNVFMKRWDNYKLKRDWETIKLNKGDVAFAWGPDTQPSLGEVKRVEIIASKGKNGKGSVFIDDLNISEPDKSEIQGKIEGIKGVSALSSEETCNAGMAVDGLMETRWSSAFSDPQWIKLDLGGKKVIDKVVICWETAYAKKYQIQVSQDDKKWYVASVQNQGSGGRSAVKIDPIEVRYVRMYGTERASGWGYSIWEFEVYESKNKPVPLSNLAVFSDK
ncbi:MAG: discoidin domain-containing protein [Elusimicrobiota bacterium]